MSREIQFAVILMAVAAVLLGYAAVRRLLYSAVDDRYGQWSRFQRQTSRMPDSSKRWGYRLNYALAFFFSYGVHDLTRLGTLVIFDLFVVFALLSPFWRLVWFGDWSPAPAAAMALAGVSIYTAWRFRLGLNLCRVHTWSEQTWRCEKCGEFHAQLHERERLQKMGKAAAVKGRESLWERISWHGFWERRLARLTERLATELESVPPPAG